MIVKLSEVVRVGMILFFVSVTGCTTTDSVMGSWAGKPTDELVSKWGAPDSTAELGDGRKVLTWTNIWNEGNNVYTCRKSFTVGANGVIERWSYNGCPRFQLNL